MLTQCHKATYIEWFVILRILLSLSLLRVAKQMTMRGCSPTNQMDCYKPSIRRSSQSRSCRRGLKGFWGFSCGDEVKGSAPQIFSRHFQKHGFLYSFAGTLVLRPCPLGSSGNPSASTKVCIGAGFAN